MDYRLEKNFLQFKKELDFNRLSKIMAENNFQSRNMANYPENHLLDSIFQIRNIQDDVFFSEMFHQMNTMFNKENRRTTLDLFFSFARGARGDNHKDEESVNILGAYGKTMYFINGKEILLEKGDRLFINKGVKHRAIGLTPRIILSFGIFYG